MSILFYILIKVKQLVFSASVIFFILQLYLSTPLTGQVYINQLTVEDGLKQMQVNATYIDSIGLVWVGTRGGLCTYNYKDFDDLSDIETVPKYVLDIGQLNNGSLVSMDSYALHVFNGNSFEKFTFKKEWQQSTFSKLVKDWNGVLWIQGCKNGDIIGFKDGEFLKLIEHFPDLKNIAIKTIQIDNKRKTLYLITHDNQIITYRNGVLSNILTLDSSIHVITNLSKSNIEKGFQFNQIHSNQKSTYFLHYKDNSIDTLIYNNELNTVFDADLNNVPILYEGGIGVIEDRKYIELIHNIKEEYNHYLSYSQYDGNHFIGTDKGLLIVRRNPFKIYSEDDFPFVWAIGEDNNNEVIVGSYGHGLKPIKADYKLTLPECINKNYNYIYFGTSKTTDGILQVPYRSGLLHIKDNTVIHAYPKDSCHILNEKLYSHYNEETKITALGSCPGIEFIDEEHNLLHTIENLGFPHKCIVTIAQDDKDNYWLAGSNGIAKYNLTNDSLTSYQKLYNQIPTNGAICSMKDSEGDMWFGASDGLTSYDAKHDTFIEYSQLENYSISSIIQVSENKCFLGVVEGLLMIDLLKLKNEKSLVARLFKSKDGFNGLEIGQNGFFIDSKDSLWITSYTNLLRVHPGDLEYFNQKMSLQFHSINQKRVYGVDTIAIESDQNSALVKLNLIPNTEYKNRLYRYQINDQAWSTWETIDEFLIVNLNSKTHRLRAQAKYIHHPDVIASEASIYLKVSLPFYKDSRFPLIMLFLIISSISGLLFTLSLNKKNKLLKIIAEDNIKNLKRENNNLVFKIEDLQSINTLLKSSQLKIKKSNTNNLLDSFVIINDGPQTLKLNKSDLILVLAEDNGSRIHLVDNNIWVDKSLLKVEKLINSDEFIKIRRNKIINVAHINRIESQTIILSDNSRHSVGKTYKKIVRDYFTSLK